MTKTTNYQLNQWEKTDRVMMEDFNADNAKLEAALLNRNCQFYSTSYIGDGKNSRTFQFPAKPIFLLIVSHNGMTVLNRGLNIGCSMWSTAAHYEFPVTWEEKSVTLTHSGTATAIANNPNWAFGLFAILEAE